jgi:hypothetical protein
VVLTVANWRNLSGAILEWVLYVQSVAPLDHTLSLLITVPLASSFILFQHFSSTHLSLT